MIVSHQLFACVTLCFMVLFVLSFCGDFGDRETYTALMAAQNLYLLLCTRISQTSRECVLLCLQ